MITLNAWQNRPKLIPAEFLGVLAEYDDKEYLYASAQWIDSMQDYEFVVGSNFEDGIPVGVYRNGNWYMRRPWDGSDYPVSVDEVCGMIDYLNEVYNGSVEWN